MPHLKLTAPSGADWEYGEDDGENRIKGPAVAFAPVVAQTRNVADTDLRVAGPVAAEWMANAQCFAGPPETPPPPGARRTARPPEARECSRKRLVGNLNCAKVAS